MKNETTESTYNNHPIMTDKENNLSCDARILEKIDDQFKYAEQNKSKIFFMRYDVRLPDGVQLNDNKIFRDFKANFIKNLSRHGLKPQYIAVREQAGNNHPHYHVALLLDGQKTRSISQHVRTAEKLWDSALDLPPKENGYGLVNDCTKDSNGNRQVNGVLLCPDDPDVNAKKDECFRRASYLAKTNTKGNAPKWQREVFSSRIPK